MSTKLVHTRTPVKQDDTFRNPDGLEFVLVGTLEWTRLNGTAYGPVAEAARDVFMDAPGAVSQLDITVEHPYAYGGDWSRRHRIPGQDTVKVSMEQPLLYVYRVQRDGKALGLVFLNKGTDRFDSV
jgi:hypothetical protein